MSMRKIEKWSDIAEGGWKSPEARMAAFVESEGGEDAYDLVAVQHAYRTTIAKALPAGWTWTGDSFTGSWDGHPDDSPQGDVYEAINGTFQEGDDYFGQSHLRNIAEPHRITGDTDTAMHATWQNVAGEGDVETTVRNALSVYARAHVEDLADTGRYDLETLGKAVMGVFATDERVEEIAAEYRAEINATRPDGITIDGNAIYGPYPRRTVDVKASVRTVGLEAVIARCMVGSVRELWTVEQAAEHLGVKPGSARGQLSRWGVRAVRHEPEASGRIAARYDAAQVKQAAAGRPGRGARTDLRDSGA